MGLPCTRSLRYSQISHIMPCKRCAYTKQGLRRMCMGVVRDGAFKQSSDGPTI